MDASSNSEPGAQDLALLRLAGRLARFAGWSIEVPSGDLYWSAELFTMLGFEQAAGPPPFDVAMGLYPDEYREPMQNAVDRCSENGTPIDLESIIFDRSGRELRVRTIGEAVRDDMGTIVRIQGAFYDVTEIVTEREERIAAQVALHNTLDVVPDVICFVDESWRFTFVNQATIEMTGMSRDELYSATLWDLFPELLNNSLRPVYERAMTARESGRAREFVQQIDRWVEVVAHPIEVGIAIFARDVTADEATRRETTALEQRLDTTLNQMQDGIVILNREWRYTYLNRMAEKHMQRSADAVLGTVIWEAYPSSYDSEFGAAYRQAMDERVVTTVRAHYPDLNTWFEAITHPTEEGIVIHLRDVSDDELRRQELDETHQRSQHQAALLNASREAMIMEDLNNVVTYWNQGAEQIYGWRAEEVIGRDIREILYTDASDFEVAAAALLRNGHWRGELTQRTKDGRAVIIECRWQAVLDAEGEPSSLFAVNSDVTLRRREQELQSRAQRMESLGTLAGGIAHDLNNVLTPLLMSVQLMKDQQPDGEQTEMLNNMEVGISRGADMIRQVLSFARGVDGERDFLAIDEVMGDLSAVALQTLPKSIDVVTKVDELPPIIGDATQVLQVLMNLVTNARDAMPDGGRLSITARERTIDETSALVSTLSPGAYALISVQDSGTGMNREIVDKIFEPFFTTKDVGSGTGLGLASSLAIVHSHGGRITAYSEPGVGSRFDVYLPLVGDDTPLIAAPGADQPPPVGSSELILVVDDEASIRQIVSQTLEANGYRTVEASNGRDAIEVFERHADDVRLVLTDMMMPVMDGAATAAYFAEHHPHVAIIAASGLHANGGVTRASNSGVRHFVAKPFTTDTLLRTVRLALDESALPR